MYSKLLTTFLFKVLKSIKDGHLLRVHLEKAKKCDRYLITVTYQTDNKTDKLEHFWVVNKFPTQAILPALSFIYEDMDKKEIVFHDLLRGTTNPKGKI